jgi:hypothetical protein
MHFQNVRASAAQSAYLECAVADRELQRDPSDPRFGDDRLFGELAISRTGFKSQKAVLDLSGPEYRCIDIRVDAVWQVNIHLAVSELNIGRSAAPSHARHDEIDRSLTKRRRRYTADQINFRIRLEIVEPHRALNTAYGQIAAAAVDIKIAILRDLDDIVDPERKREQMLWKFLSELLYILLVVRTNADDPGTSEALFEQERRDLTEQC